MDTALPASVSHLQYPPYPAVAMQNLHKTAWIAFFIAVFMFGFGFALVPLYSVFCQLTGLNGKIDLNVVNVLPKQAIENREIVVEFDVNHHLQMPLEFKPQHKKVVLKPGEVFHTGYFVKNPTRHTITTQAIPSIAPSIAAAHLKKIECFCFNQQTLGPGQTVNLPLRFYLDPKLPHSVKRLTLSYTLFDRTLRKKHDC